jgi:deoxyribodipyrimidine photo-lyase
MKTGARSGGGPPVLIWFRADLRLADNPALTQALKRGGAVIPVFIWSPDEQAPWHPGAASKWWLHQSIAALNANLREKNSRLIIRRGPTLPTLYDLVRETGATALFWNRLYEPALIARDTKVKEAFRVGGVAAESFNASLLHEPWTVTNKSGRPFQIFTPFWTHCLNQPDPSKPLPAPGHLSPPKSWPHSLRLDELQLEPAINWAAGIRRAWAPGEAGAIERLNGFLSDGFPDYPEQRNRPDLPGTSKLSPHLQFGEIGPRQIWHALARLAANRGWSPIEWRGSQFLKELGWREFAHHLLYHFPHTSTEPLRPEFKRFPWRGTIESLEAWQKGCTGYPIVDAGMRELWTTGWMHNRVRMIAASFLVKDLLISWQQGSSWFWDTLVDADLANNTLGWQWTSGCGADAAPYFRIFNPAIQGGKFDPNGDYVRRWCPELAGLPSKWIHQPQKAPADILHKAGIQIGREYPEPIVSHSTARNVALEAFARIKSAAASE